MRRRKSFNPKRRICGENGARARLQKFAAANLSPRYSGNPEHKRNPGDFGLEPPSSPRLGKSCHRPNVLGPSFPLLDAKEAS